MVVVESSSKKAKQLWGSEKDYEGENSDLVCELLDTKNYVNGDVVISDFGDDG